MATGQLHDTGELELARACHSPIKVEVYSRRVPALKPHLLRNVDRLSFSSRTSHRASRSFCTQLRNMGRRKSKRKPPPKKKMTGPLDQQFTCPFCNHEKSCEVKMWVWWGQFLALCAMNGLCVGNAWNLEHGMNCVYTCNVKAWNGRTC